MPPEWYDAWVLEATGWSWEQYMEIPPHELQRFLILRGVVIAIKNEAQGA